MIFDDRHDAGRQLAHAVRARGSFSLPLVLGLARGGVPVAYEVARALHAPLDVFVVRKLGVPDEEELAMGAVATGGVRVLDDGIVQALRIPPAAIEQVATRELEKLREREFAYRGTTDLPKLRDKTAILVDDGLAAGTRMRAAVKAVRQMTPSRIFVAVPVASADACAELEDHVDGIVCAATPVPFMGVSRWYRDFERTSDAEVRQLVAHSASWAETPRGPVCLATTEPG
ncbi:MAG TPA: phosphoribosyltransferase [Polyangiaceae bacterium]|jgi:putative phosphoribosyl transferase